MNTHTHTHTATHAWPSDYGLPALVLQALTRHAHHRSVQQAGMQLLALCHDEVLHDGSLDEAAASERQEALLESVLDAVKAYLDDEAVLASGLFVLEQVVTDLDAAGRVSSAVRVRVR